MRVAQKKFPRQLFPPGALGIVHGAIIGDALLEAIASMITVADVVFSITIVALAFAAGQYGPRVLSNFLSEGGNQITLGTFTATFIYCLMVLRTIQGGDDHSCRRFRC